MIDPREFLVSETLVCRVSSCVVVWWCEGEELPRVLHDNLKARVLELLQVLQILAVAAHSVPVPRQAESERERTAINRPKPNREQTQRTCTPEPHRSATVRATACRCSRHLAR